MFFIRTHLNSLERTKTHLNSLELTRERETGKGPRLRFALGIFFTSRNRTALARTKRTSDSSLSVCWLLGHCPPMWLACQLVAGCMAQGVLTGEWVHGFTWQNRVSLCSSSLMCLVWVEFNGSFRGYFSAEFPPIPQYPPLYTSPPLAYTPPLAPKSFATLLAYPCFLFVWWRSWTLWTCSFSNLMFYFIFCQCLLLELTWTH